MAKIITNLNSAIAKINSLYEQDPTAPEVGDEDYLYWTSLLNVAINLWENEEGMHWRQLFVKLADAADGDKTTIADENSYDCPTDFNFHASGYVWLGSGANKTPYKVIPVEKVQLYENDLGNWCYFLEDNSPTLEFNPNLTIPAGLTISYNYYKFATAFPDSPIGTETFEMADPMFAIYFVLAELRKDEGNDTEISIMSSKLEAMKTRNGSPADWEDNSLVDDVMEGFGR